MTIAHKTQKHTCRTLECWQTHYDLCLRPRLPLDMGRSCSSPLHHRDEHTYTIRLSPKVNFLSPGFLLPTLGIPAVVIGFEMLTRAAA